MTLDLPAAIRATVESGGADDALAFGGRWRSWDWVADIANRIDDALGDAHTVGLVARNRPQHIAAFAATLMAQRTTSMIYAAQSPAGIASDIETLRLPAIVADAEDWTPEALAAARSVGSQAIAIGDGSVEVLVPRGAGPFRAAMPDIGLELLSSGTTGAPRRSGLPWSTIAGAVAGTKSAYAGTSEVSAPQVMVHPLGNIAGLAYAVPPLVWRQRLVILERFDPLVWAEAVRDHRPSRGTVPPAGVRMLLDSDIPAEWLSSLSLVAVGGGKLDEALQVAFEDRFGIPALPAFGATEFGGVIANWTLDTYRRFGADKRGSAGMPSPGATLRIVDRDTGIALPPGEVGLLEAQVERIGPDFVRTNDFASLDADGFLFLHGRADGAINRGGFKIVPDQVAATLREHPAIADAAVVGIDDARLGEVPVAAIELRRGQSADAAALKHWLKDRLVAYQVPVDFRMVDALPRNASMKVSLPEVKALFQ
ncbi:class I adenylate-forming enzyme family protein [Sphingomonas crocodyli]|uniref:Acyl--CoA ligase n=1 Tax=Sphingomonas crocodyli TaxID=1979270 RepID=A0A437MA15_9SPHN|nr:fatty acid--CoA ligase family protein [Sphingomonas crocodyli]RVT94487.1 acyl--CoA ligase [Sphingomonas crocodyli]